MNAGREFLPHVVLNGDLLAADEARISPLGAGFMHGLGLFETIKVRQGRPVFFPEHFERLRCSAGELGLPFAATTEELRARAGRCLTANALTEGSLKIVVFQDTSGLGELITARSSAYSPENYERGFALKTFSGDRRAGRIFSLKTLNYLGNLQAKQAARAAGCDEALFVDAAGLVLEGATSNIFVVKGGEVLTPPLDGRILPGVARSQVLRIFKNGQARESTVPSKTLAEADEIFVTNALLGVMPVVSIDGQRYDLKRNPVTQTVIAAYQTLEAQSVKDGA